MKGLKPRTPKAKRFFQELPKSRTQSEAAIKAGYSKKSARVSATKNMQKYNGHWSELLDKAGCTDKHLAGVIVEGTSATKVIGYLENKGNPTKAEPETKVSNDFLDTPDWTARAKFSELALKLKDAFPEAKLKLSGAVELPPDTGTLDQIVASMKPAEQKEFITTLSKCFGVG